MTSKTYVKNKLLESYWELKILKFQVLSTDEMELFFLPFKFVLQEKDTVSHIVKLWELCWQGFFDADNSTT